MVMHRVYQQEICRGLSEIEAKYPLNAAIAGHMCPCQYVGVNAMQVWMGI